MTDHTASVFFLIAFVSFGCCRGSCTVPRLIFEVFHSNMAGMLDSLLFYFWNWNHPTAPNLGTVLLFQPILPVGTVASFSVSFTAAARGCTEIQFISDSIFECAGSFFTASMCHSMWKKKRKEMVFCCGLFEKAHLVADSWTSKAAVLIRMGSVVQLCAALFGFTAAQIEGGCERRWCIVLVIFYLLENFSQKKRCRLASTQYNLVCSSGGGGAPFIAQNMKVGSLNYLAPVAIVSCRGERPKGRRSHWTRKKYDAHWSRHPSCVDDCHGAYLTVRSWQGGRWTTARNIHMSDSINRNYLKCPPPAFTIFLRAGL